VEALEAARGYLFEKCFSVGEIIQGTNGHHFYVQLKDGYPGWTIHARGTTVVAWPAWRSERDLPQEFNLHDPKSFESLFDYLTEYQSGMEASRE
jgi:hypothetical protein